MSDPTHGPDTGSPGAPDSPDLAELQLRKALGTVNDLEPPRDDLFVQRALLRGRARTARRRNALLGAAAGVVVVAAVGGTWALQGTRSGTATSAAERVQDSAAGGSAGSDNGLKATEGVAPQGPGMPAARDASSWFEGPATAQTAAFASVEPTLVSSYPDVFSGAYGADASNSAVVVAVTRRDPALESLVTSAMPSPGDVSFVVARNPISLKEQVAARVRQDVASWRAKGVAVFDVRQDGRTDRVVVVADEGSTPGAIVRAYGSDLVRVVPGLAAPAGKLPNGATLPTLQR